MGNGLISKDKYPRIYLQMEAIAFIVIQILFAQAQFLKFGNIIWDSPLLAGPYAHAGAY